MEEFDLNADSEIGTSISKLRNNDTNESFGNLNNDIQNLRQTHTFTHTDTDIDYDKILENLNNSDTGNSKANFNYDNARKNMETFTSTITDVRPKKAINMTQFAKNVESDLERFQNVRTYNYNEPLPVNYSKNLVPQTQANRSIQKLEQMINVKQNEEVKVEKKEEKKSEPKKQEESIFQIFNEYRDILMYMLIFILLNNKFIIETIYDRVPFVKKFDSPYPNLIIRSVIFGLLIFAIKKFNL